MLKSLYFKLNDENEKHKEIIDFFEHEKKQGDKKIDTLIKMIKVYNSFWHEAGDN